MTRSAAGGGGVAWRTLIVAVAALTVLLVHGNQCASGLLGPTVTSPSAGAGHTGMVPPCPADAPDPDRPGPRLETATCLVPLAPAVAPTDRDTVHVVSRAGSPALLRAAGHRTVGEPPDLTRLGVSRT